MAKKQTQRPKTAKTPAAGQQTVTIDGVRYSLSNLSEPARQQLANIQATDAEMERAKTQRSILQTARNAYAQSLSGQLPKPAHPNRKKDVVVIDGTKYAREDFSEEAQATLSSLQFATGQITQQDNMLAVLNTARAGYAQALKAELPKARKR